MMPVDYGLWFYIQVFTLFWVFISLFLAVMSYDRTKASGCTSAWKWGILTLVGGPVVYVWVRYRSCKNVSKVEPQNHLNAPENPPEIRHPAEPETDNRTERKMEMFYLTLFILPMIALMFPEEALVNFYMLSVVYFVMVYAIKEEYMALPLIPRQWEVILGAIVIAISFLITGLKWAIVPGTRTYGMINFSILLIGVTVMFFGISGYRLPWLKAVSLGGGCLLVFLALLRFSFALTTLSVLVMGLILMGYGVHKISPLFMPPLIVLTLAFINTGFYQSEDLINAATQYLAPFVSQFSTWVTSLFGYNNYAEWNPGRNAWDIIFVGNGFKDSVGVVGNCTGIVGAMFYGVIATAMLLWIECELWRKAIIIIGGVMGAFITNLFRVVTLILVYWHFDYPRPDHWRLTNLMYVHQYLGDVLYIVFVTVYWFFVFKYIIPETRVEHVVHPTPAEKVVYTPPKKRRTSRVIMMVASPGQRRKKLKHKRRRKYEPLKRSDTHQK